MGKLGIILTVLCFLPFGRPDFIGEYWISSRSSWDCEPIEGLNICGFRVLYFQDDTTFTMISGIHKVDPESDSISYRVEPGINKYEGHYSIQKRKITFRYRQTYGSFFTDTSLVYNELILQKRKHKYFLTSELHDYEPTKFITDYSKKMIQADIDSID